MRRDLRDTCLTTLLSAAMAMGSLPVSALAYAQETYLVTNVAGDVYVEPSEHELAPLARVNDASLITSYVEQRFSERGEGEAYAHASDSKRRDTLSGGERNVYDYLADVVQEIARGARSSTAIEIPASLFSGRTAWTTADLRVPSMLEADGSVSDSVVRVVRDEASFDVREVLSALVDDMPSEFYWFDRTAPITWTSVALVANVQQVAVASPSVTVKLPVAAGYALGSYVTDPNVGLRVETALVNARNIVSASATMDARERLSYFRERICAFTSYNVPATSGSASYGDPWQLVYVFDGDLFTQVMCEGYSRAFKYLCDCADMDDVTCTVVTGTMNGGSHMWNVVGLDGLNYLVDITNCDAGTVGAPDRLFMTRDATGSVKEGFVVSPAGSGWSLTYVYDAAALADHHASELDILNSEDGDSYRAVGTWGTCPWEIDSEGTLTVHAGMGAGTSRNGHMSPWHAWKSVVRRIVVEDGVVLPRNCERLFADFASLGSADVSDADTSQVTNTRSMFAGCSSLESLDLAGWDTSAVDDASGMFEGCSALATFTVGSSYVLTTGSLLPAAIAAGGWWSTGDGTWYSCEEIVAHRSGVADTYRAEKVVEGGDLKELGATLSLAKTSYAYDGKKHTPKVVVEIDGKTLERGEDYTVSYADNVEAGTATVTVTGKEPYAGTLKTTFEIEAASIEDATVTFAKKTLTYGGKALEPAVTVRLKDTELVPGTDYTVRYKDNTDVGVATIIVTGAGNYAGKADASFKIAARSLAKSEVTLAETGYVFNGGAHRPGVSVVLLGKTLREGTDYAVSYERDTEAGVATVTVRGMGNFRGAVAKEYEIGKASLAKAIVTTQTTSYAHTGKALRPHVSVRLGETELKKGVDYTLSFKDNTDVGRATILVKGKGNYTGCALGSFKVTPAPVALTRLEGEHASFTAVWESQTGSDGYELQYATSADLRGSMKTVTVPSGTVTKETVASLMPDTTYYVRVRAYQMVGAERSNSSWSKTSRVTTK